MGLTRRRGHAYRSAGRRALAGLVFTIVGLFSAVALAAGYYLPVRGVQPMGRGGAVAVEGGGPHALWYNPAQMAAREGTHLLLDVALSTLDSTFLRTPRLEPNGDITEYLGVRNDNPPAFIPNLIGVSDFGLDGWAFGLGMMVPYGTLSTYPADGAQRYTLIQNAESAVVVFGLGVAYQVTDRFRVGASFQNLYVSTSTVTTASAYQGIFGQPEDPDLDIRFRVEAVDPFTPMANLGFWVRPLEWLEVAVVGQLGGSVSDDDARLQVRLPTNPFFDNAELRGDRVAAGLELPPMVRAGVRVVHERGDVELNVTWEGWSVHDRILADPGVLVLTGIFGIDEFQVGSLNLDMEWQDTWAFSLGSDFVAVPGRLVVRAGVVYEQGAIPDHRFSVYQWDVDKVAPSLGLSVLVPEWHLTIDAAYMPLFLVDKRINNSRVAQINPTFEEGAIIVGNGEYEATIHLAGIGLRASF